MITIALSLAFLAVQLQELPAGPASKGSIAGVVLGTGDTPIAGAQVKAMWSPPPVTLDLAPIPTATTDAQGRFRIEGVAPGGYRIYVTASGYVYQEYGAQPGEGNLGSVITVVGGQTFGGITLRPIPDSIVSGRITSVNGTPLLHMVVFALSRRFDANGSLDLLSEGRAETNDRGEYRIPGLKPGRYYIRAASMAPSVFLNETRRAGFEGRPPIVPTPGVFAATYYPGTPDVSRAAFVEVVENRETRNVDIVLPVQQTYRIRGHVTDLDALELPKKLTVMLIPGSGSPAQADGTFELTDVVPGTYTVMAQGEWILPQEFRQLLSTPGASFADVPFPPRGVARVQVTDHDIDNVELTIVRDLTLNGRITVEDGTAPAGVRLELRPIESTGRIAPAVGRATIDAEGRFVYKNINPAPYRFTVSSLPEHVYVKEAVLGSINVLVEPIDLMRPAKDSLNVLLARGGELEGTLTDASSRAVSNQQVVLIPDRGQSRPDLYKTVTTDANGRFRIPGIAPGDYKVFAWQTIDSFRYFDTEFVRPFEDRGVAVRITGSSRVVVADVKPIP